MNHKGTVTLETERLILRRYRIDDIEDAYRNWLSSANVARYLTWSPYTCAEDARGYIQSVVDSYADNVYCWVIEWKETHEVIGAISTVGLFEMTEGCEIGYCLSERYWGRGIMTEALSAVINYLFDEVGMNRIQCTHDTRNIASGRVMEKCGLRYEGTMRQAGHNNQGVCDVVMRAILKEDR